MRYLSFTNQEQKKNAFFSAYAIARTCLGKNESSSKQYRSDAWLDIKVWTKNCENWKQSLLSWLANISKISSVTNSDYLCINYINNYAFVKIVKKSSDHLFFLHLATAFSWTAQVVLEQLKLSFLHRCTFPVTIDEAWRTPLKNAFTIVLKDVNALPKW